MPMRLLILLAVLLPLTFCPASAVPIDPPAAAVRASLLYGHAAESTPEPVVARRRVPALAFGLSAVLPGTGQVYNGQWWKAVVSVAVEAALIAGYIDAYHRGEDGEDAYIAYAHQHWSPVKYAEWINDYRDYLRLEHNISIDAPPVSFEGVQGIDFRNPGGWTSAQAAAVRSLFNQIRAIENEALHPATGATFSHKLPYFGEQQYYELIGKYFSFSPGWEEYPVWTDAEGFTEAIDPEITDAQGNRVNVPAQFWSYQRDHARANDLLRRASRFTGLVMVNHLLAAVDAAVSAKLRNDRLSTSLRLIQAPDGSPQAAASIRIGL